MLCGSSPSARPEEPQLAQVIHDFEIHQGNLEEGKKELKDHFLGGRLHVTDLIPSRPCWFESRDPEQGLIGCASSAENLTSQIMGFQIVSKGVVLAGALCCSWAKPKFYALLSRILVWYY